MDKRRTRRSAEQWADIITRFESSGQSQRAFCDEHGLAFTTFQKHQRRVRRVTTGARSTRVGKFVNATPRRSSNVLPGLVMHAGDDVSIELPLTMDIEFVAKLARALRGGR